MNTERDLSLPLHIMLIAGEPSGDALGGQLIKALKDSGAPMKFSGVGGPMMAAQGLASLYPIDDIAIMGLAQIIPRLAVLKRRVDQAVSHANTAAPGAVVLIDSPGFNHPIARRLKRRGFLNPVIKYVAPQVWASRPGRAHKIARFIDHLLVLLPFEPPFFDAASLPNTFVGHPVTERLMRPGAGAAFRAQRGIDARALVLCLCPGSRVSEVKFLLPVFHQTVNALKQNIPGLELIVPVLPNVSETVRTAISSWDIKTTFVKSQNEEEKFAAFDASTVALAASGTVSLELALSGVPHVIGYKMGWLTAELARPFITVSYATLINIIGKREIVPEFIQEHCSPQAMATAAELFFNDEQTRTRHLADVAAIVETLRVKGAPPSKRAAKAILEVVKDHRLDIDT